jgi:Domain of unknown function (DUF4160)
MVKCMGVVIENSQWKIKIYPPPREHGPPHIHVIAKGMNAEVKINLITLEVLGKTRFTKKAVKDIIRYLFDNQDYLIEAWEKMHE